MSSGSFENSQSILAFDMSNRNGLLSGEIVGGCGITCGAASAFDGKSLDAGGAIVSRDWGEVVLAVDADCNPVMGTVVRPSRATTSVCKLARSPRRACASGFWKIPI
jgi:hypothetical protein